MRSQLADLCAGLDLSGHQLVKAVTDGKVSYFGQDVDLSSIISKPAEALAHRITSSASQLWGSGAEIRHVLLAGGGIHLVGQRIAEHFSRHQSVTILEEPVFANAIGYFRFAKWLQERGAW